MQTTDALQRFYDHCRGKGLSRSTLRGYVTYLKHFEAQYPELPTDQESIERYLIARREGPGHRGDVFKKVQAFYSYLAKEENIPSPVPARGPMGRPKKQRRGYDPGVSTHTLDNMTAFGKVVEGGADLQRYTSISTSSACLAFLQRRKVMGCTQRTIDEYTRVLRHFAVKFLKVPLEPQKLDDYLASFNCSNVTRLDYRRMLVAFYHFLEKFQYLPKGLVEVPSVIAEDKIPRTLTREELVSLGKYCQDFQEECILHALVDTKCRAGELLSMTREKLFPDYVLVYGKVKDREVPITPETYNMLCKLRSSGPLFQTAGHVMNDQYLYRIVRGIMHRAGLTGEKLGPHILRHTASVEQLMAGGSERVLQEELGHASPKMTAHYSRIVGPRLNKEHQRINLVNELFKTESPAAGAATLLQTETRPPPDVILDVEDSSQGEAAPAEKRLVFGIRTRKI